MLNDIRVLKNFVLLHESWNQFVGQCEEKIDTSKNANESKPWKL